jgi:hypothetical protein
LEAAKGKQAEMQSKERIAGMQEQTKVILAKMDHITELAVAEITTKAQDARMRTEAELDILGDQHQAAHEAGMQAADQTHEHAMADKQHQQALEQGQQGHEQALEQGEQTGQQQQELAAQAAENSNNGAGQ